MRDKKRCLSLFVGMFLWTFLWPLRPAVADENAYFKYGPLELNVPFKTADVVYLLNGLGDDQVQRSLVGGETTVFTLWQRVSGTIGVVTSATGLGSIFVGADIDTGNTLERFVNLGPIRIGGFGAYNSRTDDWMAGPKASITVW